MELSYWGHIKQHLSRVKFRFHFELLRISMSEKWRNEKSFGLRRRELFSRRRGVKFLLRDPFTCPTNLGFMLHALLQKTPTSFGRLFCTPVLGFLCTSFGHFQAFLDRRLILKHPFSLPCRDYAVSWGVWPVLWCMYLFPRQECRQVGISTPHTCVTLLCVAHFRENGVFKLNFSPHPQMCNIPAAVNALIVTVVCNL